MLAMMRTLVLLTSWTTVCTTDDVMYLPGDVVIGGLLTVYDASCEKPQLASVEVAEALRWMTSQLNDRHFLPNMTIGLRVLATCGGAEQATKQALRLLDTSPPGAAPPLIGILGPVSSSETAYVTRVLASLTSQERLPVVSFSATATNAATTAREAGNFFRVIPPDNIQTEVMAQLLTSLRWNYVALVYEDSLYGSEGAAGLRARLEGGGAACVAVFQSIPASPTDRQRETRILQVLEEVKRAQVSGMVLFTSGYVTRDILRSVQSIGLNYVEFVISEAISLRASRLEDAAGRILTAAPGALITSPPYRPNQAFSRHWQTIVSNQSQLASASRDNPWLRGLTLAGSQAQEQSLFSTYAMTGVVALAEAVRQLHMRKCGGQPGMCPALGNVSREELVQELRHIRVNLSESTFNPAVRAALTFDQDGEANMSQPGEPQYQVFNFQDNVGKFQFVKVGDFQAGQLVLNKSAGRMYPEAGPSQPLSQGPPAQCPVGRDCLQCLPQDLPDAVMEVEGDHYVVVVVPIHDNQPGQPLQCGSIRAGISVDLAEAALLAVTKVNQRQGVFQGLLQGRLGLLVVNSCNAPLVLERKLLALHAGTLPLGGGRNSSELASKVIGYVGALGSSISIPMARLLTQLGHIQISYASTDDQLGNRDTFKYFLRLSAPNSQEADAILNVVTRVGANYIQIVYSEEAYGWSGRDALLSKALAKGICVANTVGVTETSDSHNKVKDQLLKKPFAKLVILFVRSHLVEPVMRRVAESGSLRSFHWLGSETWGKRSALLNVPGVSGTITLDQDVAPLAELEDHILSQDLATTPDPWLRAFWEARLNCYLPGSFRRKSGRPCPQNLGSQVPGQYIQDTWAPYLVNAVYTLAVGWDAALRERCGASSLARVCPELTPSDVYRHVQDVRLDFHRAGQFLKVFDSNGDGTGGFAVHHIVRKDGQLIYNRVGTWTAESGLVTSLDVNLDSRCPNAAECLPCALPSADNSTANPCLAPVAALSSALVAFIIALVISLACLLLLARRLPPPSKEASEGGSTAAEYDCMEHVPVAAPRPCSIPSSGPYLHPVFEPDGRIAHNGDVNNEADVDVGPSSKQPAEGQAARSPADRSSQHPGLQASVV